MLCKPIFSVIALLGCALLGSAQSAVTIPWVELGSQGNYFAGWKGEKVAVHGETTTFHIQPQCAHCDSLTPPITLIAAPNTYELITTNPNGFIGYSSSACTLTGSPSPTAAHCSETDSWEFRSSTNTRSDTVNVPGGWNIFSIYPVTLSLANSQATTSTAAGASSTAVRTHLATATATQAANNQSTGSNAHATTTSPNITTSGNMAKKTAAPIMAIGGVLAGALLLS